MKRLSVKVSRCLFRFSLKYFAGIWAAIALGFLYFSLNRQPRHRLCAKCAQKANQQILDVIRSSTFYDDHNLPVAKSVVERGKLTRDLRNDLIAMWTAIEHNFVRLNALKDKTEGHVICKERLKSRYLAMDIKMEKLQSFDSAWQAKGSSKMALEIKNRINNLQNPLKCTDYGQLQVHVEECGFGCLMHDLISKLNIAISYNKTLILLTSNSVYLRSKNMSDFLEPVSDNCPEPADGKWFQPTTYTEIAAHKHCFIQSDITDRSNAFRYPAITEKIWADIQTFHSTPLAWWSAQMLKFLFRPTPQLQDKITASSKKFDFSSPIVGVHVRRFDKLTVSGEHSVYHYLYEYMKHVEEWYDRYELKQALRGNSDKVERRVYLATDDPTTWNETLQFPQYTFVGNIEFTNRASKFKTRDTGAGLEDIIIDITLLSKCHFLVCTLSSEIGRVAMELKQSRHDSDVFYDVRSLEYDYGLTDGPNKIQLVQYASGEKTTPGEIQIRPGDMIIMTRNYWNGFYYGTNVRSGKKGLYATHKVINLPALIELPNAAVLNTLKAVYENYLPWLFNQMISFE